MSRKLVSKGFLNKNTKALRPDKETGKWIGKETANGQFGTIKPLWSNTIEISGIKHEIEVWTFNNKWGKQILFYKLYKVKNEESLEEQM
jgi:hypothetical protein